MCIHFQKEVRYFVSNAEPFNLLWWRWWYRVELCLFAMQEFLDVIKTSMRESKSNTVLNAYLREKRIYCYYELKVAKGNTLPFSAIEVNQDEGLPALALSGLVWKLSDEDSRKKPCDGFCTPPLPAYLVIKFAQTYYFVLYESIQTMRLIGDKSITEEQARSRADHVVHT